MKKGQFFMMIMVVVTLIGFSAAYIVMRAKTGETYNEPIGARQMAILKANTEIHRALAYLDLSAVYSAKQTEIELAQNGGHYERPCGDYGGYSLWNNKTELCVPNAEKDFTKFFEDIMAKHIVQYKELFIPAYNHIYSISNMNIAATSIVQLTTDITDRKIGVNLVSQPVKIVGDFAWPSSTDTVVTSCYGPRNVDIGSSEHKGIDLRAKVGSPIYAIANGTVIETDPEWGMVKIKHDGLESKILHSSAILVDKDQDVIRGQVIARAGNTAPNIAVPVHIHLEITKNNIIDPIESVFGIDDFGITATQDSNCIYNSQNYAYKLVVS